MSALSAWFLGVLSGVAVALGGPWSAEAGQTSVAVAANFTDAANEIAQAFQEKTGHEAVLSFGSTGQLYTQITQDAPFEVFLAADAERPQLAEDEGLALPHTRFTYATGRIVLWSRDPDQVRGQATLEDGDFDKIAIANPVTAPYGAAAVQAMEALGVHQQLESKIVQGNNIAQTYQFVETGNAELGFVALAQLAGKSEGSRWEVPLDLYPTIRQDAVLLERGADNQAARAFLAFLQGPDAARIIARYGYGTAASS